MDGLRGENKVEEAEKKVDKSREEKSKINLNQNNGGQKKRQ